MYSSVDTDVIPNFSNPLIFYKGKATGDATHDNSMMLRSSACTMANAFIGGDTSITAYIAGVYNLYLLTGANVLSLKIIKL